VDGRDKPGHDEYGPVSPVIARTNGSRECAPDDRLLDEAIQLRFGKAGLLRCARNDVLGTKQ
jgi:hypothetical protein